MAEDAFEDYRWTLTEYVLRCEQGRDLAELVVEGELDRVVITDAFQRWGLDHVNVLDAEYISVSQGEIAGAGFNAGVKGGLLTIATALRLSKSSESLRKRIAVLVDRDYDDTDTMKNEYLLVTDGYSMESYALNVRTLERFSAMMLGRGPLPAGRRGILPLRRTSCSGSELYERIIHGLADIAGVRIVFRELASPIKVFSSWLDYAEISRKGYVTIDLQRLLRNQFDRETGSIDYDAVETRVLAASEVAVAEPARRVRGHDFVNLLEKLLRSRWGRKRGGDAVTDRRVNLARILLLSVDSSELDSSGLFQEIRSRFGAVQA